MTSGSLITLLAIVTLSLVGIGAVLQMTKHLRDPKNMDAAKSVVNDESSATTAVRGGETPDHLR